MRYTVARLNHDQREAAYRIYISDCLRQATENTAKIGGGGYMTKRFFDVINSTQIPDKTADEIVADITERAGIEVV